MSAAADGLSIRGLVDRTPAMRMTRITLCTVVRLASMSVKSCGLNGGESIGVDVYEMD